MARRAGAGSRQPRVTLPRRGWPHPLALGWARRHAMREISRRRVSTIRERGDLAALPRPVGGAGPPHDQRQPRRGQRSPDHVVGPGLARHHPGRGTAALDERDQPPCRRRGPLLGDHRTVVELDDGGPLGAHSPSGVNDHRLHEILLGGGADQEGGGLQGVEPRVVQCLREGSHLLHVDAVHLAHLGHQQVDEGGVGKLDRELVDRPTGATLEDVYPHDLAPHGAYARRHLAQCARPIGHPHPHDERLHGRDPRQRV